jgi:adenylate kinase family enzyme
MVDVGRRIVVRGPTGSGKSTTAARLARCLGVPHIEMDAIHWLPGWVEKEVGEFRADLQAALDDCPDGWVCDGNYSKVRDLTLPRADTVVWLRPPLRVAFWRLLKRILVRALRREKLWGTNYESLRLSFLSRDSLLLYQLKAWRSHHRKTQKALDEVPHRATVYELRSPRQVEEFLESVCAATEMAA